MSTAGHHSAGHELPSGVMRLLLCGHHRLVLDALGMALTDNGHAVVATALDPDDAIEAADVHQPDVCLLDVDFLDANELKAIGRIREVSPDTKLVIVTSSVTCGFAADAIAGGAHGIVGKDKPIGDIVAAMELAHRGSLAVDPPLLRAVFRRQAEREDPLRALKALTDREWDVLGFMVDGLTTDEMASALGVRANTVRQHVNSLFKKLDVHTRLQAAALVAPLASVENWPARSRRPTGTWKASRRG